MLTTYFKTATRSISKNKMYSFINITGLTIGIACCMLITLFVKDELSYDQYNSHYNETYRVLHAYRTGDVTKQTAPPTPEEYQVWGNAPVGPLLKSTIPGIVHVTQFTSAKTVLMQQGSNRFQQEGLLFADEHIFDVFSWKFIAGDPATALVAPNAIVLTKSIAEKYFGSTNIVGKSITADDITLNVTAVMEDVPSNSHFTFTGLISMETFKRIRADIFSEWGYVDFYTYFTTTPNTNLAALNAKIPTILKQHRTNVRDENYSFTFEPLKDAYLHSKAARQPGTTGSMSNIVIFSLVAAFMLVIAGINFVNLSTARSMERAKEIGVRKAVGAQESALILQYLTEAVLLTTIATILAVGICYLCLPLLRQVADKSLPVGLMWSKELVAFYLFTPLLVGIPAGIYPAFVLAKFKPVKVLKGRFTSSAKGLQLRRGLVVFQFSLSIALIACTAIVYSQLSHLQHHSLGFDNEQLLVIDYGGDELVNKHQDAIKLKLAENPAVKAISISRAVPGDMFPDGGTGIIAASGERIWHNPSIYEIDEDFMSTLNIPMAAGRTYSKSFPADTAHSLVVNEATAKLYGYSNPADIIGKSFDQWGRTGVVIGVVKDFNYESLHQKVKPLALRRGDPDSFGKITLRLQTNDIKQTIQQIETTWNTVAPHRPFLYSFLDQAFNRQYQKDERFGQLFSVFGILTILIACLGLFGLVTYSIEKRIKEIGIRRTLGASIPNVIGLLSKDFVVLILIAILIATPIGWYAMRNWLNTFAYSVEIQWWIFLIAGSAALTLTLLTIGILAFRAARINPIKALRTE
ncbi:putative ABC transport system permease protein [Chitinophaga skermanii]|uniref:Putative ABC transport system permease protein n=1 Tax=Chitinophaga skermanii TaxID=331697 RepID=A0A327QLE8_9BACT|nr:ABC transporter permease [Chitinophaga skermanii]RAJ05496.1 putative ABC transport system permease protein [Chitinophaga skermanii]